jgi:uncharacterized protein YbaR (Trm112 family)
MSGVDPRLLEILVCPLCKGKLAYPVKDGIPVMLEDEARKLSPDEEVV